MGKGEKVVCQIKHFITVSENNFVFHAVITDAWNDYGNTDTFNQNTDEIILIVASLSKIDNDHTRILFEWARCCENSDELIRKIATDKFSSTEKQKRIHDLKSIQFRRFQSTMGKERIIVKTSEIEETL